MLNQKRRLSSWLGALAIVLAQGAVVHTAVAAGLPASSRYTFDTGGQTLTEALKTYAQITSQQIIFREDMIAGRSAPALKGEYTAEAALAQLLAGTGLTAQRSPSGVLMITRTADLTQLKDSQSGPAIQLAQSTERSPSSASEAAVPVAQESAAAQSEIVVTGTNIRGAQPSSPVVTITQREMKLSGHSNLGEVIRSLPQNFAGGQNPGVIGGGAINANVANQNLSGSSSMNLRGLGPDATLTLVNGARMPYDGFLQGTDVSVIPVAAIERLEILLDGASAVYGSDAVGGVTNIILKRDYDGAELSARWGGASDGGYEQIQYTGVVGKHWGSGGFLLTANYSDSGEVRAKDRDYLGYLPSQDTFLYPALTQKGALLSAHQQLAHDIELSVDAFHSERDQQLFTQNSAATTFFRDGRSVIWGVAPAAQFSLPGEWSARLFGSGGSNQANAGGATYLIASGAQFPGGFTYTNEGRAIGFGTEGPVFAMAGGDARLSVGAGYRKSTIDISSVISGDVAVEGSDRNRYLYGEINLPFVSPDQGIPFVSRLSVNGAARYENYASFGETTTPRLGAIWSITPAVDVKVNWGRSFKAPTLYQQHAPSELFLSANPAYGAPAGTTVLIPIGGDPALGPERAEVTTAGLAVRPSFLPGLSFELGWFDIRYTDRVVEPINPITQGLRNPVFDPFITRNPTLAQQDALLASVDIVSFFMAYNPASVHAILDNRYVNASSERTSGIDLSARYDIDLSGDLSGSALALSWNGSWLTDAGRKLTANAPQIPTSGVVYFPAKFRGRLGASWRHTDLTLSGYLNHTGAVADTNATPNPRGDAMTTLDLTVNYEWRSQWAGDIGFSISAMNIFNERPPYLTPVQSYDVNFDPTNYSALGRVIGATLTKRW